jgi:hypothetical protein
MLKMRVGGLVMADGPSLKNASSQEIMYKKIYSKTRVSVVTDKLHTREHYNFIKNGGLKKIFLLRKLEVEVK